MAGSPQKASGGADPAAGGRARQPGESLRGAIGGGRGGAWRVREAGALRGALSTVLSVSTRPCLGVRAGMGGRPGP